MHHFLTPPGYHRIVPFFHSQQRAINSVFHSLSLSLSLWCPERELQNVYNVHDIEGESKSIHPNRDPLLITQLLTPAVSVT